MDKVFEVHNLPQELRDIPAEQFQLAHTSNKIMDADLQTVSRGFFKDALFRLRRNKAAIASFCVLCFIIFMAIFGPMMTP